MGTQSKKKIRKGTKKNNVVLREKILTSGNISLYLDIYRDGVRSYEFLKLYVDNKARTPIETQAKKETLELAEQIRTQRESELNHAAHGFIAPIKKKTLYLDYVESYQKAYTKKDERMIKGATERFKSFLTDKMPGVNINTLKLSQVDKQMIVLFVEYKSPAKGVEFKVFEAVRKDFLSNDEIALLAKTPTQNTNVKRAFILSCCTGLRFCDVKELKYSDIDFATDKLTINQQKTGVQVTIDLNPTAKKLIGEPGEPKALVFDLPTHAGSVKTVQAWVTRAKIEKHITWHCARHSFAVNLLTSDQRPDIKTVASTLGHTSLKHTEKYTRVVDDLKKKAVNALPEYEV
jgi:integrase/recombinase XerD